MASTTKNSGRKTGFYREHPRVVFTGKLVNHKTGEIYTPTPRTKQSFVEECDINNILKQYKLTGQIRHINANAAQGAYQDLPDPIEFQDAMNLVIGAEAAFASLPSAIRNRFSNNPTEFLSFVSDPSNQDEVIKLGLAKDTRPPVDPQKAPAESPAKSTAQESKSSTP